MKIICIGVNYKKHAVEMGRELPEKPVVFLKPDTAIIKNSKPFFLPKFSENVHYEAEVVMKICKVGRSVSEKFAYRYYSELTLGIDMTARDLQAQQAKAGLPWEIAKSFDGSAPLGMFISKAELGDVKNLPFSLQKNGITVQESNTSDLIFSFDEIIAYVSKFFTLKTGDLIFTGTPAGVGPVVKNDRLTGYLDNKMVFDFLIK